MDFEKTVIEVLSRMGSGKGIAHSEELLFAEVIKSIKNGVGFQNEINYAIKSLVSKGVIVHDSEKSHWIYLKK
ncbi:MAG: hypothetical protein PUJ82_13720 [Spirochaetales bacterium]|nr:hypothetical protein [Spirochaetales bacterium]MDY5916217.1 hypothetical protein [Treponema sp.]